MPRRSVLWLAFRVLWLAFRVDNKHVAVRLARDALADAATIEALEEAGFVRADNDQVGIVRFGGIDDLCHWWADR
jgi:hypothetical protein